MRTWTREQQNAAWRRWYAANRDRKMEWQARRRAELQQWWRELKATMRCRRCGERAPECLHLHHRDASQKEIALGDVSRRGWKKERILAEVAKCEVLCANCHMKHHWQERSLSSG